MEFVRRWTLSACFVPGKQARSPQRVFARPCARDGALVGSHQRQSPIFLSSRAKLWSWRQRWSPYLIIHMYHFSSNGSISHHAG